MISQDDPRRPMYEEVMHRPRFIRENLDVLDDLVRATLPKEACRRWTRVLFTGCGDSFYAGLACEYAFETWTGLPVDVQPSLIGARYTIPTIASPAVVFSISHSGRVSRTIETAALAHALGLDTIAVSGNPDSPITKETRWALAHRLQTSGQTPGVRSYTQAQLLLLLSAIYIGECRGVLSQAQASNLQEALRTIADVLDASLVETDNQARALAERWHDETQFLVIGSGPNYANALFSAAKLIEACGINAVPQELEEWAHIQFFLKSSQIPTLLIAPPGRSLTRAVELVGAIEGLHALLAIVGARDDAVFQGRATHYFGIDAGVEEALSPLLTSMPAELIACHLAHLTDERFFRADGRGVGIGRGRITESHVLRHTADL